MAADTSRATRVSTAALTAALLELPEWRVDAEGRLRRTLAFPSFTAAVAFLQTVAPVADGLDHHPDVEVHWRTVELALSTHDAGGALTERDLVLARAIERLVAATDATA